MEKTPDINRQLNELNRIAQRFDQEALNDGEASLLKHRVNACVEKIREVLPEIPLLSERDYKQIQSKYQRIESQFSRVFTPQNEKEFEALKKAHDSLDSIREKFVPQSSFFETYNPLRGLITSTEDLDDTIEAMLTESEKLDRFIRSDSFKQIGLYLQANMEQIVKQLEENPLGGKSLYIRRSESGLLRSIQVFLPEGKAGIDDLMFVVQLKQHGRARKRDMLQEWLPFQIVGADPERLQVIGKGSYKVAKHSLSFPAAALNENGIIDTKQMIFSTTLTPKTQSKEYLDQIIMTSDLEVKRADVEEQIAALTGFGLESVEKDARYISMFQGPGILPLVGSSRYSGSYQMRVPTLYESWMGSDETLRLGFTKFSMVTLRCDGDLSYDPDRIFDLEEKKSLARDIVAGIQTIHDKGHQHGDVKPDNILFKREKGILRAYLVDFGLSRPWYVEERRMGTPSCMPIDASGQPVSNRHYDTYATGLSLLGLLTHQRIISPSEAAINDYKAYHHMLKTFAEDPEKMKAEAEKRKMPLEDLKEEFKKKRDMWKDVDFLCGPKTLESLLWDDEFSRENPLAFAFVKVLYLHHIPEEELWSEEVMSRLFSDEKRPIKGDDLTVPLLRQLYAQIESIKHEDDMKLDLLIK